MRPDWREFKTPEPPKPNEIRQLYDRASRLVQVLFWLGVAYAVFVMPILAHNPISCFSATGFFDPRPHWEIALLFSVGVLKSADLLFQLGLGVAKLPFRYRLRSR